MIQTQIKNALLNSTSSFSYKTYAPKQYKDRHYEYFNDETRTFINEIAKYSNDYVDAEVQGLNPELPYEYTKVHLRFANIVKSSGASSTNFDNYKNVLMVERQYGYFRRGAKIKTMGNTWLVINPQDSADGGTAVIQRCDAVWNYLDYYGNVCSEPMCIDNMLKRANTPDSQRSTMITKGYFNAIVQYNETTKQLNENSRIVLGSGVYMISGFSDFQRDWTDEEDSVNLIEFTLRYDEPNDAIDDMKNHVAGGKTFGWNISIEGESAINVGETVAFGATSVRTNGGITETVEPTTEHPVDYIWESSNESIAEVDAFGNVTGMAEGKAIITAILSQNEDIKQEYNITVAGVDTEPHVGFTSTYPDTLSYNRSITFHAEYYENGSPTGETVTWSVSNANDEAYTFTVDAEDPNSAVLTCWGGSVTPAIITATYGDSNISHTIYLEGI